MDKLNNAVCKNIIITGEINNIEEIEKSIYMKYRTKLWSKFTKGIKDYDMIQKNDKIAICISGGKDSLLLAKCMQELQKHSKVKFSLEFIAMNPGFNKENLELLKTTCEKLEINVKIFDTEIFSIVDKIAKSYPCYMCARMRRGALYTYAKELGCNKIALGHHYDDFIETTMLNVLFAGNYKAMLPKIIAKNHENMQLIRPLVYVRERDIIAFTKHHNIKAMNCGCVVASKKTSSKRSFVKELLKDLRQVDPMIDKSIFSSAKNVEIDSVMSYTKKNEKFNFMDKFQGDL